MAQFRLSAEVISRSSGRSVVAAAAYRSGEKLLDRRTGYVKDYSHRQDVLYSEILAPSDAPRWMREREELWNAVELVERRKDSQLARDIELSLPHELTLEQHVELVREFVKEQFTDRGMIADVAIHAPPKRGDGTNHHAHILLTMRDILGEGFGPKNRGWNDTELLEEWRERWADCQNRALEKYGHEARVDHRSLKDQGIDREPTKHLGPAAQAMEDQGIPTNRGDLNRDCQGANDNREKLQAELAEVTRKIAKLERARDLIQHVNRVYEQAESRKRERKSAQLEIPAPHSYAGAREASPMPEDIREPEKRAAEVGTNEQDRQEQARKAEEDRKAAAAAEEKRLNELGQKHRDNLTTQGEAFRQKEQQLKERREELQRFSQRFAAQGKIAADQHAEEQRRQKDEQARGQKQGEREPHGYIREAGTRYAQALQNYDVTNPYQSLAKAAMAEHAAFRTEQDNLSRQIAGTANPKEREALELRKKIEGYEYLIITGERIVQQSYIITGRKDGPDAVKMHETVYGKFDKEGQLLEEGYVHKAKNLREQYRGLQAEPTREKDPTSAAPSPEKTAESKRQEPEQPSPKQRKQGPEKYAELVKKLREPDDEKEREKQQELERKLQRERGRER